MLFQPRLQYGHIATFNHYVDKTLISGVPIYHSRFYRKIITPMLDIFLDIYSVEYIVICVTSHEEAKADLANGVTNVRDQSKQPNVYCCYEQLGKVCQRFRRSFFLG